MYYTITAIMFIYLTIKYINIHNILLLLGSTFISINDIINSLFLELDVYYDIYDYSLDKSDLVKKFNLDDNLINLVSPLNSNNVVSPNTDIYEATPRKEISVAFSP